MYIDIQKQKDLGFSKRKTAEHLGVNYRTVERYWSMTPDECQAGTYGVRGRELESYDGVMLEWLRRYPDMSAAMVHDWLKEHYQVAVHDRTVRRHVQRLREVHEIPKVKPSERQYQAVEDPPMGQQMQVDMGTISVVEAKSGSWRKVYVVCCVLSHSRYKWGTWFASPPTAEQFVDAIKACFGHFGGMPRELVFDQDRLLAVSENYGDIIYTKAFESFRQRMKFDVYLCRGADPESKGRIEAVVKYIKRNFARHRRFTDIDLWNASFLDWLQRTGNAMTHGITKKIPAEVMQSEQAFLKPVPDTEIVHNDIVSVQVRQDNTVLHLANRYSVPLGTYTPGRMATLEVKDDQLRIYDAIDATLLAEHPLSTARGELISNRNHRRDYSASTDKLQAELLELLGSSPDAETLLCQIRTRKRRYVRDQYGLMTRSIKTQSSETIRQALVYCVEHKLYSAVDFRDALHYFANATQKPQATELPQCPNPNPFAEVSPMKRPLSEYAALAQRGNS